MAAMDSFGDWVQACLWAVAAEEVALVVAEAVVASADLVAAALAEAAQAEAGKNTS
jgi:hypothetical protein